MVKINHHRQRQTEWEGSVDPDKQQPADSVKGSALDNKRLAAILEGGTDWNPLAEIERLFTSLAPGVDLGFVGHIHADITAMFAGRYPGFRGGPPQGYHDLRHTRNVALAAIRLFHGLHCRGMRIPADILQLGLACAYFHDTGMLLSDGDQASTGTAYLKNHEERSTHFLQCYLLENDYCLEYAEGCAAVINCTNLMVDPRSLPFPCPEVFITGQVVGTADILAQMADRYYLESLPLLYLEFHSAGIHRYSSSLELLRQTTKFFHEVIAQRLSLAFDNICQVMQDHFRVWWQIDRNLYLDCISKNISYLERAIRECDASQEDIQHYFRRKQPIIPL